MERSIKFRAKSVNGELVYGCLVSTENTYPTIYTETHDDGIGLKETRVVIATAGQFTGIKDSNGVDVYEGDIISSEENPEIKHVISYKDDEAAFIANYIGGDYSSFDQDWINVYKKIVIGNIHDNPELLDVKESE